MSTVDVWVLGGCSGAVGWFRARADNRMDGTGRRVPDGLQGRCNRAPVKAAEGAFGERFRNRKEVKGLLPICSHP